jgi:hypothetical protein
MNTFRGLAALGARFAMVFLSENSALLAASAPADVATPTSGTRDHPDHMVALPQSI